MQAAIEGEITRGEVARLVGMSERTGRDALKGLLEERLLVSSSERGPVRLGFPAHAAGYWFPDLYPAEGRAGQAEAAERVMRDN
jgi:DNA-binding IclR family transcriptional regulator